MAAALFSLPSHFIFLLPAEPPTQQLVVPRAEVRTIPELWVDICGVSSFWRNKEVDPDGEERNGCQRGQGARLKRQVGTSGFHW